MDRLKWAFVVILLLGAMIGNFYLSSLPMTLRMLISLLIFVLAGYIALQTRQGAIMRDFFAESHAELRKVVWPTREETMQTTLIVGVMVVVLALVLWGMDGILMWIIGWLTGQKA